jgi:IS30 family transposase
VEARRQIDRALVQLNELAKRIPREEEHLSEGKRTAILELAAQGLSCRQIARVMGISPQNVRRVVGSNSSEVPLIERPEKAEPYRQQILELLNSCKGNLQHSGTEIELQTNSDSDRG